jgi:hypothetical protein
MATQVYLNENHHYLIYQKFLKRKAEEGKAID